MHGGVARFFTQNFSKLITIHADRDDLDRHENAGQEQGERDEKPGPSFSALSVEHHSVLSGRAIRRKVLVKYRFPPEARQPTDYETDIRLSPPRAPGQGAWT